MDNWEQNQQLDAFAQAQQEPVQPQQGESGQYAAPEQPQQTAADPNAQVPPYTAYPGYTPWGYAWQVPGYTAYPGYGAAPYGQTAPAQTKSKKSAKGKNQKQSCNA